MHESISISFPLTHKLRALRRQLIPYAEAQAIYTDDDVFRDDPSDD